MNSEENLERLGWGQFFSESLSSLRREGLVSETAFPARVVAQYGGEYAASDGNEVYRAVPIGRMKADLPERKPCVGDFVLIARASITATTRIIHVLERKSLFRRRSPEGNHRSQAIAANIDVAIVVCALSPADADERVMRHGLNPSRIERYLAAISEAPARAIVALNKSDLRSDALDLVSALATELVGTDVVLTSAQNSTGLEQLSARISAGETCALVGSSGVGKSSIVNQLTGSSAQRVGAVRDGDARGRHTTSHRELFVIPTGGCLIDTPGMRQLGLISDSPTNPRATGFDEIDALAESCRYANCRHDLEPGCAVKEALESGQLSERRLEHARKLRRELEFLGDRRSYASAKRSRQQARTARGFQKRRTQ